MCVPEQAPCAHWAKKPEKNKIRMTASLVLLD